MQMRLSELDVAVQVGPAFKVELAEAGIGQESDEVRLRLLSRPSALSLARVADVLLPRHGRAPSSPIHSQMQALTGVRKGEG
jgi:hypothetical protein